MESKLTLDKILSFWTHAVEYTLSAELKPGQLAELIDGCTKSFLPSSLFEDTLVNDLKGCGPQILLVDNSPAPEYPEELVYVSGGSPAKSDQEDAQTVQDAFEIKLLTSFDQFLPDNHISHRLATVKEGSLAEKLGWQVASAVNEVSFNHFRMGLEVFHSKVLGDAGAGAVGDQRFFLEADQQRFKLLIGAESLHDKLDLPLAKYDLLDRLSAVINDIFVFDLKSDYVRQM